MVCQPKSTGGLGLRHMRDINNAFMAKVSWGLIHKKDKLWTKVIKVKYGYGENTISMIHAQRNCSNI